jgi:hypothetical protein
MPTKPTSGDWVFLMTAIGLDAHYEDGLFADLNPDYAQVAPTGSKVTPVDVKAVGGITYKGSPKNNQTMIDHTLWLYDGDPTTVWTPSVNRTTQTFLFDLGVAHDLTHITITPEAGTIIPTFRVDGSNDGKLWHTITDTSIRDVANPGAGSEPLAGVYRYVKVILHNAANAGVGADALDTLPYQAMYNPMSSHSYAITRITDVAIYSNGEGEPVAEVLIPGTRVEDAEPETAESDTTPAEIETSAGAETVEKGDNVADTAADHAKDKGCASIVGAGSALVASSVVMALIAAAAALWKKKDS